jgi:hypothetical protein
MTQKRQAAENHNKRAHAWLKKTPVHGRGAFSWKPRTWFRRGTCKAIEMKDNQIRVMTGKVGLRYLLMVEGEAPWTAANWRQWPSAVGGEDQGGEGFGSYFALAFHKPIQCNLWYWWEWSHGCCNDVDLCYNKLNKLDFQLLMLIALNLKHGPDKDPCARYFQSLDATWEFLDRQCADGSRLFHARADRMLQEFGDQVDVDDRGPDACLFDFMAHKLRNENLGPRCELCEYMSWQTCTARFVNEWTYQLMKWEYVCLETGALNSKALLQLPHITREHKDHVAETTSTRTSSVAIEAKVLRGVGKNNMVCVVAFCSNYPYRRQALIMVKYVGLHFIQR